MRPSNLKRMLAEENQKRSVDNHASEPSLAKRFGLGRAVTAASGRSGDGASGLPPLYGPTKRGCG